MIKSTLKSILYISIILAIGQIRIGKQTLGSAYLESVRSTCIWGGHEIMQTKFMAGFSHPAFLDQWFSPDSPKASPAKSKKSEQHSQVLTSGEEISVADKEAVARILQ